MPIYQVEAPDGKIIQVEGPENAPQDQILNFAISNYLQSQKPVAEPAPAPAAPEEGDFMRGVKSWLPGFQDQFCSFSHLPAVRLRGRAV